MLLFEIKLEKINELNNLDFAKRIVRNFIKVNTKEDIDYFIIHATRLKVANKLSLFNHE